MEANKEHSELTPLPDIKLARADLPGIAQVVQSIPTERLR
jgi:hypothetical protein